LYTRTLTFENFEAGDTIYTCGLGWLPPVPHPQLKQPKRGTQPAVDPAQAKLEYERAGGYVLFTLVYNIAYSPSSSECTAPLPEQVEYYFHRDDHAASNRHKLC
jgi:hypothetical protein